VTRRLVLALVGGLALAASACGVPSDESARTISPDELPPGLARPTSTTAGPSGRADASELVQLYYVRDGVLEPTLVDVGDGGSVEAVLEALRTGPDERLARRGYRSAIGGPDVVRRVRLVRGVATVDLGDAYQQLPPGEQRLGLGEIVLTLTGRPGVGQLRFTLDGQRIDVPTAEGTVVSSVSRDDYVSLTGDE
jgi:spore germination protein GerM